MFLSSYVTLFLILGLRWIGHHRLLGSMCFALAGLGLLLTCFGLSAANHKEQRFLRVVAVQDAGAEVAGYLATYLLPFVTVGDPSTADLAGYGLFGLVSALIFVRTSMIQVNPTLYLLRYRVFKIECEPINPPAGGPPPRIDGYLITRDKPPEVGSQAALRTLRDTVMVPA
jgi:hypothetical protein